VREWSARREKADRSRVAMAGGRQRPAGGGCRDAGENRAGEQRQLEQAAHTLDLGGKIALTRGAVEGRRGYDVGFTGDTGYRETGWSRSISRVRPI
jgi:hypothetical protein